ncbi:MAG: hypothetical protein Q9197_002994 [Variospora fuerteventurae]
MPTLAASLCLLLISAPTSSLAAAVRKPPPEREPACTGSYDWLSPRMDAADCAAAIEKIGRSDGARYGNRQFEFVGRSGVRKTPLPPMHTPRRYTAGEIKDVCLEVAKPRLTCAGTCTVVIAMLNIFPEADLPDPPKNPLGSSDVTTFHDLYLAADNVLHHCVTWLQQAGYQQEGVVASIGVLLMATDSLENHSIPPGVNPADTLDVKINVLNRVELRRTNSN